MHNARDFWLAFTGRTLLIFSYYMILNYQLYILESYIGQSKTAAAATISIMSVVTMVVALIGSLTSDAIQTNWAGARFRSTLPRCCWQSATCCHGS